MRSASTITAQIAGLIAGSAVVLATLAASAMPHSKTAAPAKLTITTARAGELIYTPKQRIASSQQLRASGERAGLAGKVTLRNPTDATLLVRPVAAPSPAALDRTLLVEIRVRGLRLFEGPLSELRTPSAVPFLIAPGERRAVRVRAWIPEHADDETTAYATEIRLEWRTTVLGAE